MMNQHFEWVNIAKGLGIILVVLGHAPIDDILRQYIFAFHMPLFFLLSGVTFKGGYTELRPVDFARKKGRSLLIPYFTFSIITYAFWFFLERPLLGKDDVDAIIPALGIFYSAGDNYLLTYNPAIWFLTCLFMVEIGFYVLLKYVPGNSVRIISIVAVAAAGYFSTRWFDSMLPWSIQVATVAVLFFGLGYLLKARTKIFGYSFGWVAAAAALSLIYPLIHFTNRIDMRAGEYQSVPIFISTSLLGITGILFLSFRLEGKSRILSYLGQNSLIIFALHFMIFAIIRITLEYGFGIEGNPMPITSLWGMMFTAATLVISVPFVYLIKNKAPFLIGK
ncbi:acyltransferase family protein [uncultured Marinococcus sp.]|uniref:acyltransferase family protein n=1 Tax=uncultured Marinococcus sp. TaxID=487012 RepID=UPI002603B542|nr:acyltransferase family protein [uncultured Marinococcus sp.]